MRFVLALVALVLAAGMIAFGLAQRTVLKPADHVTLHLAVPAGVKYVVVPGSVLTAHSGRQRLELAGADRSFAAYGRTSDVLAWLAQQRYAQVGIAQDGALIAAVRTAPAVAGVQAGGDPDPNGSDLWLEQERTQGPLDWTVNVPASVSLLIASDGSAAAPSKLSLNWPVRVVTPWAVPLIVGGGLLGALGLLLYVWALVHVRRKRGPRRTPPPKLPRTPQPPRYRQIRTPVTVTTRGRRSVKNRVAIAGAIAGALLVPAGAAPALAATSPAPAAGSTAAVTEEQAQRIVARAAAVAAKADADLDATLLATRFAGPALALRTAAYTLRKHSKKYALPQAIPVDDARMQVVLPQATTSWPRALFAVVTDGGDAKVPPVALTLVQNSPRDDYQVQYEMPLEPGVALPSLPASTVGAPRLRPDTDLLLLAPQDLAADYGLVLRKTDATLDATFDLADDPLAKEVGIAAKRKLAKATGSTGLLTFKDLPTDPASVVAMATASSGAIVSVELDERETVKPAKSGVQIKPSGATKVLSKTSQTGSGIASVYGYQLLFSVPAVGSKDPVRLLGYAQGLISAKEL